MKKKIDVPNIPMLKNPVIAINIDFKKKKEHLVIGDFNDVNNLVRGRKNIKIIFDKIRPLGSFLLDIITEPDYFADVKVSFCEISKEKYAQNISVCEGLFEADNPILKYLGLKLWEEYTQFIRADKEKDEAYPVLDRMEDMTLPFRYNLMNEILMWQKHKSFNPLLDIPSDYYRYPLRSIIIPSSKATKEYVVSDFTLLPLILYYLKTIYEQKKYFSYCKVCGKLFLAPDNNKTVICSKKCKDKQNKLNKQKFDAEHKGDYTASLHKNEYQYWYNRLAKAKRKNNEKAVKEISKAFEKFSEFSTIKKKQVDDGLLTSYAYYDWCMNQRILIDEIMEKYGLDKRG